MNITGGEKMGYWKWIYNAFVESIKSQFIKLVCLSLLLIMGSATIGSCLIMYSLYLGIPVMSVALLLSITYTIYYSEKHLQQGGDKKCK